MNIKILTSVLVTVSLFSCKVGSEQPVEVKSISGKYQFDLTESLEYNKDLLSEEQIASLPPSFVIDLLSSTVEPVVTLTDSQSGSIELKGLASNFKHIAPYLGLDPQVSIPSSTSFSYKIEQDSMLYIQWQENSSFKLYGTLDYPQNSFKVLQVNIDDFNHNSVGFILNKIK